MDAGSPSRRLKIGFVTGIAAEARLLARFGSPVEIGGGGAAGAADAAARLLGRNIDAAISFGLAGGLDPALPPGALLIPRMVVEGEQSWRCDAALLRLLGGANCSRLASAPEVVASVAGKTRLFRETGAAGVDLESAALARLAGAAGIGFAVLRAVADPAGRFLPQAALGALNDRGNIRIAPVLASLIRQPGQIPALIAVARDAGKARAALAGKLRQLGREAGFRAPG